MKDKKTVPPENMEEKIQRLNSELGLLDVSDVAFDFDEIMRLNSERDYRDVWDIAFDLGSFS